MAKGLVGKKIGCTQLWKGEEYAMVTAIKVVDSIVIEQKTADKHGYNSIKVGYEPIDASRVTRPVSGVYTKLNIPPHRKMLEFRDMDAQVGSKLDATQFVEGEKVEVVGTSRGMGFQGVMKRHGFAGGDDSHGAMQFHRRPGSIGCRTTPGHVIKGMRMPGHMGYDKVTVKNLKVIKVDTERGVILLKGAVPGPKGGTIIVRGK